MRTALWCGGIRQSTIDGDRLSDMTLCMYVCAGVCVCACDSSLYVRCMFVCGGGSDFFGVVWMCVACVCVGFVLFVSLLFVRLLTSAKQAKSTRHKGNKTKTQTKSTARHTTPHPYLSSPLPSHHVLHPRHRHLLLIRIWLSRRPCHTTLTQPALDSTPPREPTVAWHRDRPTLTTLSHIQHDPYSLSLPLLSPSPKRIPIVHVSY